MSLQTYVFFKKDRHPSVERLQSNITQQGFNFVLPESINLLTDTRVLIEGKFEGLESCFDYLSAAYNEDDWPWAEPDKTIFKEYDLVSVFNAYSNAQEIVGMIVTASVLTHMTSGTLFSEFFDDDLISADRCIAFAKETIEASRDQFCGPSKLRRSSFDPFLSDS